MFGFLFVCALCIALPTHLPPAASQLPHEPAVFFLNLGYYALINAALSLGQGASTSHPLSPSPRRALCFLGLAGIGQRQPRAETCFVPITPSQCALGLGLWLP